MWLLFGPPPTALVARSTRASHYFERQGAPARGGCGGGGDAGGREGGSSRRCATDSGCVGGTADVDGYRMRRAQALVEPTLVHYMPTGADLRQLIALKQPLAPVNERAALLHVLQATLQWDPLARPAAAQICDAVRDYLQGAGRCYNVCVPSSTAGSCSVPTLL